MLILMSMSMSVHNFSFFLEHDIDIIRVGNWRIILFFELVVTCLFLMDISEFDKLNVALTFTK